MAEPKDPPKQTPTEKLESALRDFAAAQQQIGTKDSELAHLNHENQLLQEEKQQLQGEVMRLQAAVPPPPQRVPFYRQPTVAVAAAIAIAVVMTAVAFVLLIRLGSVPVVADHQAIARQVAAQVLPELQKQLPASAPTAEQNAAAMRPLVEQVQANLERKLEAARQPVGPTLAQVEEVVRKHNLEMREALERRLTDAVKNFSAPAPAPTAQQIAAELRPVIESNRPAAAPTPEQNAAAVAAVLRPIVEQAKADIKRELEAVRQPPGLTLAQVEEIVRKSNEPLERRIIETVNQKSADLILKIEAARPAAGATVVEFESLVRKQGDEIKSGFEQKLAETTRSYAEQVQRRMEEVRQQGVDAMSRYSDIAAKATEAMENRITEAFKNFQPAPAPDLQALKRELLGDFEQKWRQYRPEAVDHKSIAEAAARSLLENPKLPDIVRGAVIGVLPQMGREAANAATEVAKEAAKDGVREFLEEEKARQKAAQQQSSVEKTGECDERCKSAIIVEACGPDSVAFRERGKWPDSERTVDVRDWVDQQCPRSRAQSAAPQSAPVPLPRRRPSSRPHSAAEETLPPPLRQKQGGGGFIGSAQAAGYPQAVDRPPPVGEDCPVPNSESFYRMNGRTAPWPGGYIGRVRGPDGQWKPCWGWVRKQQ